MGNRRSVSGFLRIYYQKVRKRGVRCCIMQRWYGLSGCSICKDKLPMCVHLAFLGYVVYLVVSPEIPIETGICPVAGIRTKNPGPYCDLYLTLRYCGQTFRLPIRVEVSKQILVLLGALHIFHRPIRHPSIPSLQQCLWDAYNPLRARRLL